MNAYDCYGPQGFENRWVSSHGTKGTGKLEIYYSKYPLLAGSWFVQGLYE